MLFYWILRILDLLTDVLLYFYLFFYPLFNAKTLQSFISSSYFSLEVYAIVLMYFNSK